MLLDISIIPQTSEELFYFVTKRIPYLCGFWRFANAYENLVREEMKRAITSGYMNADKQKMWVELFGVGHIPDPEEFIMKIGGRIGGSII